MSKTTVIVVMLMLAFFTQAATADDKAVSAINARMSEAMGGKAPDSVVETPIKGVYQVGYGSLVFYLSADGRYLLKGNLIDLAEQRNLTEESRGAVRKVMMDGMDKSKMIIYGPKKAKHHITVFTDIDCPYCRRLHQEVPELTKRGIEVRYLFFPRAGLGSGSYNAAVSVWCAKDQIKAMDDAKNGLPVSPKTCDNPIGEHMALVEQLGLTGTPAIILEDGELISGYRPAKDLADYLDQRAAAKLLSKDATAQR